VNSKHAISMNDLRDAALSLKQCEELKTENVPNSALWAFFLCPTSKFSSCIYVATSACSVSWVLFFTSCCCLPSAPSPVPVAPSALAFPSPLCSACSPCRRTAHLLSQHSASVISRLAKRSVRKVFVLSADEDDVVLPSGQTLFDFLCKCGGFFWEEPEW